ncbi:TRAP transporter substrate-binding protein [Azohydromonas caseinilytica]|uniref:TRAP transporter substrate-binding protein n=1 Tax=Azohydromonas caseinilytica TaxID=2728836 RepID=A0A848FHY6_9BURK|nr:TRAP transporter substrate-binding protein [Azohydromonas caseinilytica]NML18914.1 TRAP transporter substrate-binding protein [Azohydromonas caseinilytica]
MKSRAMVLAAASLLAALAAPAAAQKVLKVGIGLSDDHPQGVSVKKFGELLSQKTGGKLTARLYAGGALGNDVTMISALRGGTQEMVVPDTSTLVSLVKDFTVLNLPLTFQTEQEADALLDGPFGRKLLDQLPAKGLIGLAFWENGFRHVSNSRRPITKAEDFAGLKIRVVQNPLFIDTFNALGANAVPMPFTELYTALEQKAVDGQENPTATILASKFYEVQKHVVLSKHIYSVWVLLLSKKTWDGLSPDEQKAVQEAAREATAFERKTIRDFSQKAIAELKKQGMQVTELPAAEQDKLRQKLQPVVAKYSKEAGEATAKEMFAELEKIRAKK